MFPKHHYVLRIECTGLATSFYNYLEHKDFSATFVVSFAIISLAWHKKIVIIVHINT